jgi:hypothetical protein
MVECNLEGLRNKSANKSYLLSAIIPINNADQNINALSKWLPEIKNFSLELIMVHDIANEDICDRLNGLVKSIDSPSVYFINGKYGSPGLTRNAGLRLATGSWISFWDCDDLPLIQNVFSAIYEAGSSTDVLVGKFLTRSSFDKTAQELKCFDSSFLSVCMNPGIWRMVFRQHIVQNQTFKEFSLAEDQLFLSQIGFADLVSTYSQNTFYEYLVGGLGQLSKKRENLNQLTDVSKLILHSLKQFQSEKSHFFNLSLIFRQQITLGKFGNFRQRLFVLSFVVKLMLSNKFLHFATSLRVIIKIIQNFRINKLA